MRFLRRVAKEQEEEPVEQIQDFQPQPSMYLDLGTFKGSTKRAGSGTMVRLAEVESFEDLRNLVSIVYEGNILILDFTTIANDELSLRRIMNELKRLVQDVNGDMAGISKNLLMITPRNISIDRQKIRKGYNQ